MTGVAFTPGERLSVFTQCSKCETVYRLSADVLRAAGGQVRCGRCGEVFNALARLAENAATFKKGESPLDLETRADNILHSVDAVPPVDTTPSPGSMAHNGPEIAHLKIEPPVDEDLASEASLEFTLHPGDLDRVFIETSPSVIQLLAAESAVTAAPVQPLAAAGRTATGPAHRGSRSAAGGTESAVPRARGAGAGAAAELSAASN